jgi:hypothetical protein
MISSNPQRRRRCVPRVHTLESRRLLSFAVASEGQDGQDIVGPDASQGGDGIVDLDLAMAGLSLTTEIASVSVASYGVVNVENEPGVTPTLQWATAPDTSGYAFAEYFYTSNSTADLYINPEIRTLAPAAGTGAPISLGGSTGALPFGQLQNGDYLDVTVLYKDGTSASDDIQLTNLTSATDPMPEPATPSPINSSTFNVTWEGQPNPAPQTYEQGYVHLLVTPPTGQSFSSNLINNFGSVSWTISDDASGYWTTNRLALDHNIMYASLEQSDAAVDLYFPPDRSESPVNGSTTDTMLLQVLVPNDSNTYVTPFMGGTATLADLTEQLNTNSPPADPTTGAQLQADSPTP